MTNIFHEGLSRLTDNNVSLDEFGKLLDDQWKIKRNLTSKISSKDIDLIYETGIKAGALGGKLLGAGGGGFMLFFMFHKNKHTSVRKALKSKKLFVPFRFEFIGSKIVYYSHIEH